MCRTRRRSGDRRRAFRPTDFIFVNPVAVLAHIRAVKLNARAVIE
jgi:hypothetical protein